MKIIFMLSWLKMDPTFYQMKWRHIMEEFRKTTLRNANNLNLLFHSKILSVFHLNLNGKLLSFIFQERDGIVYVHQFAEKYKLVGSSSRVSKYRGLIRPVNIVNYLSPVKIICYIWASQSIVYIRTSMEYVH